MQVPSFKKRRYWPNHVSGDTIDEHFADKDEGGVDSLHGSIDNVPYDIFCMKEPDYVMKIMATYGGLTAHEGQKESVRKWTVDGEPWESRFQYKIPFSNHFDFRHVVDDHNNLRHQQPSIEGTWTTHRWSTRVFSFLLAVSEVNAYLAFKYFVWGGEEKQTLQEFRVNLAWALIGNDCWLKRRMLHHHRSSDQGRWSINCAQHQGRG